MYLYVYNYIVCTLRQKIKINCHSKTWIVLNLLSASEVWHRNRLLNVSRSALWCSFSYVSYLGTAESWQGVSPHHQVLSKNCSATPETQQQYVHLVIQWETASASPHGPEVPGSLRPEEGRRAGAGRRAWIDGGTRARKLDLSHGSCVLCGQQTPTFVEHLLHTSQRCSWLKQWWMWKMKMLMYSLCLCVFNNIFCAQGRSARSKKKKKTSPDVCVVFFFSSVVGLLLFDSPVTPCYAILGLLVVLWWLPVLVSLVPAQHGDDCCLIWGLLCFSEFLLDRDVTCHWQ